MAVRPSTVDDDSDSARSSARRSACSPRSSSTICAARCRRSIGYLQLLRDELGERSTRAPARAYLDDAETLVGKALGLVSTILDVDELEDGILRAQLAPVRLVELIERARAGNRAHFEVRQLRCDVDVDPRPGRRARSRSVRRVIENLLDNATRYAPRGGRCGDRGEARRSGRRDRDRQQRPAGAATRSASRSSAATSRSRRDARRRARIAGSACTSASSRSRRTAARFTSRSAAISARCSWCACRRHDESTRRRSRCRDAARRGARHLARCSRCRTSPITIATTSSRCSMSARDLARDALYPGVSRDRCRTAATCRRARSSFTRRCASCSRGCAHSAWSRRRGRMKWAVTSCRSSRSRSRPHI